MGIEIFDSGVTGNVIQGNYIGTNAAGTAAIPNGNGIFFLRTVNTVWSRPMTRSRHSQQWPGSWQLHRDRAREE